MTGRFGRSGARGVWCAVFGVLVTGLSLSLTPAMAEDLDDFRYQRSVVVDAPGWVGVRLDGEAQIHQRTDLAVLGPNGEAVPFRLESEAARRDARVLSARRQGDGWSLEFDLGAQPLPHRRLYFELAQWIHAPDCQLAGSDDRQTWTSLAAGDLFRFGAAEGLQQQALDYQESRHRYLRLSWSGGQDPPQVKRAQVATADIEGDERAIEFQCQPLADGMECELQLPRSKAWIERLDLTFTGSSAFGFQLWAGDGDGWRSLQRGVRRSAGTTRVAIAPALSDPTSPAGLANARSLRLEIYGGGASLGAAQVWLASSSLVFEAETAGNYVLAYGRSLPALPKKKAGSPDGPIAWVTAGEEQESEWPAWPDRLVAPLVDMPDGEYHQRWSVSADAAKGEVVRLELPGDVDRASMRLSVAQKTEGQKSEARKQVPFVRMQRAEPGLVERLVVTPESQGDGRSEAIAKLDTVEPDAHLRLLAPGPFERRITGEWQEPARPGVDGGLNARLPSPWRCNEPSPMYCETTFPGPVRSVSELQLTFRDGDNPPLAEVRVEHWAPRHELWFVWPGEPVVLYEGVGLGEPNYDMSRLERQLFLRPASQASLAEPEELKRQIDLPSWVLWLALGLAAVVLVWQLGQVLRPES